MLMMNCNTVHSVTYRIDFRVRFYSVLMLLIYNNQESEAKLLFRHKLDEENYFLSENFFSRAEQFILWILI